MQIKSSIAIPFGGVPEWSNEFLSLFPHRFDYIYAEHPDPGQTPDWQTESRHPLSDRLIQQGSYLYGVRFGLETKYCLLDIDAGSVYHPKRDPFAIARILAALEPLGLVAAVPCTSSYSGGIHLYFPFEQPQKTWNLAVALHALLENAGFKVALGQLEVFPNPKLFVAQGKPNLYAAHRLPMQAGSYLLNEDWELTYSSPDLFWQQWQFTQQRNDICSAELAAILKSARRKQYCVSGKADKFLNDLNADIEPGWTGHGQTNHILGRIAMRSYVFGHLLYGSYPLKGKALADDIVRVAKSLPGYEQWCQHQHEIEKRAEEWARCVENSHYFPFGIQKKSKSTDSRSAESSCESSEPDRSSWNQQQSEAARERIRKAIADLLDKRSLPATPTARFQALLQYQIGGGSLYRHRDLWHPAHLLEPAGMEPVENPPDPPAVQNIKDECDWDCGKAASQSHHLTSLLLESGCNTSSDADLSPSSGHTPEADGGNSCPILNAPVHRAAVHQSAYQDRMQRYLASGDPILMAEAIAHLQAKQAASSIRYVSHALPDRDADRSLNLVSASVADVQPEALCNDPADLSAMLALISVHVRRLGWSSQMVSDRLFALFGKPAQSLLSDWELMEWLEWLEETE